ncbi:Dabb family protein [Streptomyces sp. NBC_00638]|uniref:Dabb family protein n=1 Tax=Streptomyces sp. NBC_00638 TaxID=2975794 RepID=UPI002254B9B4|nr:Dabb family protein [Streptomyces sp. NBC_00638]MCX5009034.1 Dabb family protein [Streptomyces sp. NBC_00638]
MLTHVVLMRFKDPADAPEARRRLEQLAPLVREIRSMTLGLDVLDTPVSYHLSMITSHAGPDELAAYQRHPEHLLLAAWLRPRLADRAVVDSVEEESRKGAGHR